MCVLGVIAYKKTKKDKLNNTENIIESKIMQKEKAYTFPCSKQFKYKMFIRYNKKLHICSF